MKITYDPAADALYIRFEDTTVTTTHLAEGIAADYDAEGKLAGIEILDAIKRFGDRDTLKKVTLEEIGAILGPYMMPIGILSIICGIIWLIFAIQIIHTAAKKSVS